jgi:hypothetical protein
MYTIVIKRVTDHYMQSGSIMIKEHTNEVHYSKKMIT